MQHTAASLLSHVAPAQRLLASSGLKAPVRYSAAQNIAALVRDRNDQPLLSRLGATEWSLLEDAPAAFVVGTFEATDPDIDGTVVTWRESTGPWDDLEVTIESGNNGTRSFTHVF